MPVNCPVHQRASVPAVTGLVAAVTPAIAATVFDRDEPVIQRPGVVSQSPWRSGKGRRGCRLGHRPRAKRGVLAVSIERPTAALRDSAGTWERPPFLPARSRRHTEQPQWRWVKPRPGSPSRARFRVGCEHEWRTREYARCSSNSEARPIVHRRCCTALKRERYAGCDQSRRGSRSVRNRDSGRCSKTLE
jgi:hypothetical protein